MALGAALRKSDPAAGDPAEEGRELFAAYVMDDASREAALDLARARGWPTGDVVRGDLAAVGRTLAVAPPPRFMIIDIGDLTIDEIEETVAEIVRAGTMLIALGDRNDVSLYRRLRDAGARDYLYKPIDSGVLNAAFARIESPSASSEAMRGRKIAFIGARGGIGTSILAANAAWLVAETLRRRVALIDPDVHFGTLALQLDVKPNAGLKDGLQAPDRLDRVFVDHAAIAITKQLRLFASEDALDGAAPIEGEAAAAFLDHAARECDVAIVDMPRHALVQQSALLREMDAIVLVFDPSLAGLRDAGRILRFLRAKLGDRRIHLVVSNRDAKPEVTPKEIAAGLDQPVDLWVPHARDALNRADMAGEPIAKALPQHPLVRGLGRLSAALAGVREPPRRSFWRALRRK